jgi:anti-anti-sigma factor
LSVPGQSAEGGKDGDVSFPAIRVESLADDVVALRLVGEHGVGTLESFREALEQALARGRAVAIDCSLAEFTDGSIFRTVLEAQDEARNQGTTILLEFRPNEEMQTALEASGLLDFFPIADSELGAVDLATSGQSASWRILGGPESSPAAKPVKGPRGFRWRICRLDDEGGAADERHLTVFVSEAPPGEGRNETVENARATQGRSIVDGLLGDKDPPAVVTVSNDGSLVTEW